MKAKDVLMALGGLAIIILLVLIAPIILAVLWPVIIPNIFPGLVTEGYIAEDITIIQSLGLIIITSILFRSFSSKTIRSNNYEKRKY